LVLVLAENARTGGDRADENPCPYWVLRTAGPPGQNTQIYEGTNQVQRVVIAKNLLR
jgi:hypothetical protein